MSMDGKEYAKFRRKATKYVVEADQLFRQAGSGVPLRHVMDNMEQREQILHMMHDEFGHKGREGTYSTLQARYWWQGMYKDVSAYIKQCSQCQLRDSQERMLAPSKTTYSTQGEVTSGMTSTQAKTGNS
ncbi:uncharacterized protein CIMG_13730 [Coccidioides immitis RS]|uniref:Integrase zinc-binding domain-containing protein n=1 Tax=Coccidioides immitis (strain RS) TaxID=246410 RepID=A0A0D8JW48_COCIM|nr:uncharacterized protein CIMG_13730 [Coccidioides immitis RS]KJF61542.1 hypothetical protein CIMG_13730 [Coccidioides immitis RS]